MNTKCKNDKDVEREITKCRLLEARREFARRKEQVVEWEREMKRLEKLYRIR